MSLTFTKNAVDALNAATSCARQLGHDHIGSEHLLLSILAIPKCQASQRLVTLGLSLDDLSASMKAMVSGGAEPTIRMCGVFFGSSQRKMRRTSSRDRATKGNALFSAFGKYPITPILRTMAPRGR